ncbi:MAG: hypothetical protein ACLQBD_21565 [Syntrophobacteraceae bacterium]
MDYDGMIKEVRKVAQSFAEPINFQKLIEDGVLTKKGRSYYVRDMNLLPENVGQRIKTITSTRNGQRVTFYKESKSLKKVADKLSKT